MDRSRSRDIALRLSAVAAFSREQKIIEHVGKNHMEGTAPVRTTHVIAVGNQKGGVGKTTNTVQLAAALAEVGKRCLIFDLDMNHGATRHFGVPPESYLGTFEVLSGMEEPLDVVVDDEDDEIELPPNLHLIPARRNLENIDETLRSKNKFFVPRDVLMEPLEKLRGHYDYIFLDTAPNATTPTVAAYWAADWFLLTVLPEHFAIEGLGDALRDIEDAQKGGNTLELLGVIVSGQQKRPKIMKALTQFIEEQFSLGNGKSLKFETEISRSVVVSNAQAEGKTIFQTEPRHKVTEEYRSLARELEARIAERTSHTLVPQAAPPATAADQPQLGGGIEPQAAPAQVGEGGEPLSTEGEGVVNG